MDNQISSFQSGKTQLKGFTQGLEKPSLADTNTNTNTKLNKKNSEQISLPRKETFQMQVYQQNGAVSNAGPSETGRNIDMKI